MKKQIVGMMLLGASVLFLGSCSEKSRIDELKDLVEKVQQEGSTYTEEQWEEVNKEFSDVLEKLNNMQDLSSEELHEIAKLQGEYAAAAFKQHAGQAMEKAGALLDGFMEGLTNDADSGNQPEQEEDSTED